MMSRCFFWCPIVLGAFATAAIAQPPAMDIHLVSIDRSEDSIVFGAPVNVTERPGYDNQPSFWPGDGSNGAGFYFTSIREDEQADIYAYDIGQPAVRRITFTAESEYSPTPLPGGGFSTVRVEADSTQRLWEFPVEGEPVLVNPNVTGVGYHAWIDSEELILFVLGDPHELHRARRGDRPSVRVVADIGRALQPVPGRRAGSFTQPRDDDQWMIRVVDMKTGETEDLVDAPGQSQDFAWSPWRTIWMVDGTRLMEWAPGSDWVALHDFADSELHGITRLAVSDDGKWLALVAAEPANSEESR